ncbi:MAG TPA: endolytic transglycosylase MltG [Usitatibacter sp.]|nr:endolytic transglycosylase MltG [Usitatibacter sp.]
MHAIKALVVLVVLAAAVAAGWVAYNAMQPRPLPRQPYDFTVKTGAGWKAVSRQLAEERVFVDPWTLWLLARLRGSPALHAGTYRLDKPLTGLEILDKLARGDVMLVEMRFIEGTTFRQWMAQLAKESRVRATLAGKPEAEVKAALGIDTHPEGWLFPDTYRFAPGTSDVELLKRAHAAMKKRLEEAWAAREADLPLKSPYEALILASIVEKETGIAAERPLIASVFVNRLRKGMRLQTDPTVIYGMGEAFDGNIRKKDLTTDTPWNTYTRDGLPPTPIAMPGQGSLQAVARPSQSDMLYFVGKGDGTHHFSRSLEEHNRAVARYQLKR